MKPVPWRAILCQNVELGAQFMRLSLGGWRFGAAVDRLAPLCRAGDGKKYRKGGNFRRSDSQCVPIWFLGHFLMCPIATSFVNWLARQPRSCTSRTDRKSVV